MYRTIHIGKGTFVVNNKRAILGLVLLSALALVAMAPIIVHAAAPTNTTATSTGEPDGGANVQSGFQQTGNHTGSYGTGPDNEPGAAHGAEADTD